MTKAYGMIKVCGLMRMIGLRPWLGLRHRWNKAILNAMAWAIANARVEEETDASSHDASPRNLPIRGI